MNLSPVFDQYLHYKTLPILEFMEIQGKTDARWTRPMPKISMPVKVRVKGGEYKFITPTDSLNR
jgi:hypothetical protein